MNREVKQRLTLVTLYEQTRCDVWRQYELATEQRRHQFSGLNWIFEDKKRRGKLK